MVGYAWGALAGTVVSLMTAKPSEETLSRFDETRDIVKAI